MIFLAVDKTPKGAGDIVVQVLVPLVDQELASLAFIIDDLRAPPPGRPISTAPGSL